MDEAVLAGSSRLSLDKVLLGFGYGGLSVNDGILSGNFQKTVQVLFQLEKSCRCDYVEIRSILDFLDVNQEWNLVKLVNEVVDFLMSCGF